MSKFVRKLVKRLSGYYDTDLSAEESDEDKDNIPLQQFQRLIEGEVVSQPSMSLEEKLDKALHEWIHRLKVVQVFRRNKKI